MDERSRQLFFGLGLIILGSILLLSDYGMFRIDDGYSFAAICFLGGIVFLNHFRKNQQIGLLILSAVLLFLCSAIVIDSVRFIDDNFTGILFFGIPAVLFIYGYILDNSKWGYVIPAGISATFALLIILDAFMYADGELVGSVFFLGIGLTFAGLYLLRNESTRLDWAKLPAVGFSAFALFVFLVSSKSGLAELVFPLLLMGIGAYLIYRGNRTIPHSA